MAKLTLSNILSFLAGSAPVTDAANNAAIQAAFENTLSRDGTAPNQMGADFDMNGYRVLNVATPTNSTDVATKSYVDTVIAAINAVINAGLQFTQIFQSLGINQSVTNAIEITRIKARAFIGKPLNANDGGDFYHIQGKDWLETAIQASTSVGQLVSLADNGTYAGGVFGARTSDFALTQGYSFGSASFGFNDTPSAAKLMITNYNETRAFPGSSTTQSIESDIINLGAPYPRLQPYTWQANLPATINLWLSNGRPDIQMVYVGGTVTAGNTVTLASNTPGFGSVTHTVVNGDTYASIAADLVAKLNSSAALKAVQIYASQVGNAITIGNSPISVIWSGTYSGATTLTLTKGNNSSTAIGIINNNNNDQTAGSYINGIFFDRYALAGSDGSDGALNVAEAIALARHQAINFYNSGSTTAPANRIFSRTTSTTTLKQDLTFRNDGFAVVNTGTGTDNILVTAAGVSVPGVLSTNTGLYIPGSGGTPVVVSYGAADSGGVGFRMLRIPN